MPSSASPVRSPKHLRVVGGWSLVWNAFGAFDYLMTQLQVSAYMDSFTPTQLAYFYAFPVWVDAAWAVGVWGSVLGSLGLLMQRRWAAWAFGGSLLGLAGSSTYTVLLTDGVAIMGGVGVALFSAVIWLVTAGLFLYAHRMTRAGVLR